MAKITTRILKDLEKDYKDIYVKNIIKTSKIGTPDLLIIYKGKAIFFELKVGNDKLSLIQLINSNRIKRAGGFFYVVSNIKGAKDILNSFK